MKAPILRALFALGLALGAFGCASKPSESLGKDGLGMILKLDQNPKAELKFHKTDGHMGEIFGQEIYSMAFEAEVKVKAPLDTVHIPARHSLLEGDVPARQELSAAEAARWAPFRYKAFDLSRLEAGSIIKMTGTVALAKSEKGWALYNDLCDWRQVN